MDVTRTEVATRPFGKRGRRGSAARLGLLAVPLAFFALFFAWPVAAIVARGLKVDGAWQLGRIVDVVTQADIRHVLWFTTWQALASTALTLLVALPGAYVFARLDFPGKQVLRAVVTVPFVLPTVVVGTAFLALVGRGGLLDELWGVRLDTTVWAILLAHVFFNYAVVVRTVGGLWAQLDPRQEEAARMLVYRIVDGKARDLPADAFGSVARWSVILGDHGVNEFMTEFLPEGLLGEDPVQQAHHQRAISAGIASGAAEIQLNLTARRWLQLPGEKRR